MADIQFQEEQEFSRRVEMPAESVFIRLVYKTGLVSTKTQAEYVLLGFVVVAILVALFIIPSMIGPQPSKPIFKPGVPISPPMLNT